MGARGGAFFLSSSAARPEADGAAELRADSLRARFQNLKCPEILAAFRASLEEKEEKKKRKELQARVCTSAKKLREESEEAEFSEDGMLGMNELQARRERKINEKRGELFLYVRERGEANALYWSREGRSPSYQTQVVLGFLAQVSIPAHSGRADLEASENGRQKSIG